MEGPAARFGVDTAAVEQASGYLGLEHQVKVTTHFYAYYDGRYIGLRKGVHRIGLDCDLTPREASQTLWHELTHARQASSLRNEHPRWVSTVSL
jgi:hypothetical protein